MGDPQSSRMLPAYEPDSVLISNGLAAMGFACRRPSRPSSSTPTGGVVAASGDGGFLMNAQELETVVRVGTAVVNVLWEDGGFGSITWKRERRFGRHFGTEFGNPDFVALAESFGIPASRCETASDSRSACEEALARLSHRSSLCRSDYSPDVATVGDLRPRDRLGLIDPADAPRRAGCIPRSKRHTITAARRTIGTE